MPNMPSKPNDRPPLLATLATAALLVAAAGPAAAATFAGSLPNAAADGVILAVDCTDSGTGAPASLSIAVEDTAPALAPVVSAQIRKGNAAVNTTDSADADGGASPAVFVNGGAGRYDVWVDKSAAGAEAFVVSAQCWTGAGASGSPAGTAIFAIRGGSVPASSAFAALALGAALVAAATASLVRIGRRGSWGGNAGPY